MTDETDQQRWAFGVLVRYCRWVHRTWSGREPTLPALRTDLRAMLEIPEPEIEDRLIAVVRGETMNPRPDWMVRFHEEHGVWPMAGGSADAVPPGPGEDEEPTGGAEEEDPDVVPREEHDALMERMKAADRNRSEAQKRAEAVEAELQRSRVELAVHREAARRAADGRGFVDLDVVLKVLDLDSIATDGDGEPVEVGAALDHLADRHPYLLAEHASPTTTDRTNPSKLVPSGRSVNVAKKQGGGGVDRKKLEAKYPSLRRRDKRWP